MKNKIPVYEIGEFVKRIHKKKAEMDEILSVPDVELTDNYRNKIENAYEYLQDVLYDFFMMESEFMRRTKSYRNFENVESWDLNVFSPPLEEERFMRSRHKNIHGETLRVIDESVAKTWKPSNVKRTMFWQMEDFVAYMERRKWIADDFLQKNPLAN